MSIILNPHVTTLKESSTLAINQKAMQLRKDGKKVYHFGFGQSPFEVPPSVQESLMQHTHHKQYLPTLGLPELREQICAFYKNNYGYSFSPESIIIGPGSKELIFQAVFVLEGALIIPAPSWVSYGPQAHLRGKQVVAVPTKRDNGYKLTPEELDSTCMNLISDKQKILILNNPNNPTGNVYTKKEVQELAKVCKFHNVVVISDEIYSLVNFSDQPIHSFMLEYPEGTIVTSGLSKGFSAGGYRLGFLATAKELSPLIDCLKAMISETFSAVSAPIQYASIKAFSLEDDVLDYVQSCTRIHKAVGKYMYKRFVDMGLNCVEPQGAFYLYPDFENFKPKLEKIGITSSKELCDYLLDKVGVAVLPSEDFYHSKYYLSCRVATVDYDGAHVYSESLKVKDLDEAFLKQHAPNIVDGCDAIESFLKSLD